IAGHIDSKAGPAVFYRLDELDEGDEVIVHGADGETRTFTVRDAGQYPKTDLPDEVFGFGEARPELRLITCGGSFDSAAGHYVDNLVVYAAQDATV
ncbi:sortase domain-bontaining protein, partial [Salsipaludibacter albus]|uniref:sortase domain-containing protein n=1 Tax=Salsipaludibacter albus TaxID=2849650 RepID=UPI001EE3D3DC